MILNITYPLQILKKHTSCWNLIHTASRGSIYLHCAKIAWHTHKRAPNIRKRALHIRNKALFVRKRALHIHKKARNSCVLSQFENVCIIKRTIHIRKRAYISAKEPDIPAKETNTRACSHNSRMCVSSKSPTNPQKNPIYLQKSLTYPQKRPIHARSLTIWECVYYLYISNCMRYFRFILGNVCISCLISGLYVYMYLFQNCIFRMQVSAIQSQDKRVISVECEWLFQNHFKTFVHISEWLQNACISYSISR